MTLDELKKNWKNNRAESGRIQEKIWDERAEEFKEKSLPTKENHEFLRYLYEKIPVNRKMSVLDIGCGAGQITLSLARDVAEAVGADVSGKMIEAAREYAMREKTDNVKFYKEDWQTADLDKLGFRKHFDLVYAHMTPAIADYETLDKMNDCTKEYCLLVKPARRRDFVQDEVFEKAGIFGQKKQYDDAIVNTFSYLWQKGYEPELSYRKETWEAERSLESMRKWCVERARLLREITCEEEEKILKHLKRISRNGTIADKTITTIVTICWKV
ncbi:MAG: class I SAM-dependent methyltransferase [Ruminococcus sp.]|jgi:SAM-dependent methyltransferase